MSVLGSQTDPFVDSHDIDGRLLRFSTPLHRTDTATHEFDVQRGIIFLTSIGRHVRVLITTAFSATC